MDKMGGTFNKSKYLIDNFDRALAEGWVEVYFQPIIRTSNGRVCAEEALVRWEDPRLGMLNPMDFVPSLEAVNIVHKLDLYVLDIALAKMNEQIRRGLYVVPTSINLSQVDFYTCDVVEEVAKRVEKANISRRLIAIEVSEETLSAGNDYIISQLEQFRDLGFQVWMDDYGSGDAALTILQKVHFDALKINMFFVQQIKKSERARIILTELVRLAMSLGMETVVEGVEFKEQIEFLQEIGCTKLQGFIYSKPLPISQIFARYENGTAIGFENPKESSYYSAVGKISLYDISFARNNTNELANYFDAFPIAILETSETSLRFVRGNESFKRFMNKNFPDANLYSEYIFGKNHKSVGVYTMNSIRKCGENGKRRIIDDRTSDGHIIQMLVQRIAVNPVTKVAAVVIAILQVNEGQTNADSLTYNYIARALSEDYVDLFFVNMDTEDYVEYNPDGLNRDVSVEMRGQDFFRRLDYEYSRRVYADDIELMRNSFTKENVLKMIEEQGSYSITYRRMVQGVPTHVILKAVKVRSDRNHILIGINNIDAQIKERELIEKVKEERIMYSRVMSLVGDMFSIYLVDPDTEHYVCFNSTDELDELKIPMEDDNFFVESRENAKRVVHRDDLREFLSVFTKENVLTNIKNHGIFIHKYRFRLQDETIHVMLRATLVEENTGPKLIVGIMNIENQFMMEQEYAANLQAAEDKAFKDQLTGVKNKRVYVDEEERINLQIKTGSDFEFGIVVCDINGLKQINDTKGHQAGDAYIKEGCEIICDAFSRSPVFRIGGDEFVAIVQGKDYDRLNSRISKITKINDKNKKNGKVTIAVGSSVFNKADKFVSDVFERADSTMYANKKKMKEDI
ncbi:MAG: GGDEF domain-containing protein [Pseudobutyrivibrio sp.]|uniref:bifunctional diguanylate cyclase/phosphodiesterase n=1 Tax=Pseudobutyrivibrio sp. TaxID=2014367 RepID=UPI0025D77F12|nr:GGDEF domain-containing protein [Pseudobutyrivibrio sp.]MBQ6462095.1 GGDEF domain-containing protein [Pseudobutyrivibrio sp.]